MYGNDGDDEKNRHGNTSQGDEYTEKDGEAAEDFGEDGDPCHEVRCGRAERLKDGGEVIGAATEFGEAVLYEAESDDGEAPRRHRDEERDALAAWRLYTSYAADDLLWVDLGGRRIIKKKKH